MIKNLLSIIIPDRNGQPYLQKTIDDIIFNAEGEIEIIVVCDGVWPDPALKNDPRVIVIHHGTVHENLGMRTGINRGIAISHGEYIMKLDEHCQMDKGFDTKLKADCKDNWIVIPRRFRLQADEWKLTTELGDTRPPIDYMQIDYPYQRAFDKTCGLHGAEWKERFYSRTKYEIDDTPTMQGSCWFLKRAYFDKLFPEGLDSTYYGEFTQEAQELSFMAWFTGGRVVVNKRTWYAHTHKGKRGKGYGFSNEQYARHMEGTEKGRIYCIEYWMHTKEFLHDFKWFVNEKFPDMVGWEKWETRIEKDKLTDFSRVRQEKGEI